jgi:DNA-binding CsgD family transcriptional regulator
VTEDDGGGADLERSLAIALQHGFQEHAARAYTNLATCAVNRHRYAEGARHLAAGLGYCEEHDLDSWRVYMLAWRARAWLELGEWDKAGEDADAVVSHPRTAPINRIPALIVLGSLRTRRGDPGAGECFEQAAQLAEATAELQRLGPLACARADAAWLAGDTGRIAGEMARAFELARPGDDLWKKGAVAVWLWRVDALGAEPLRVAAPYALEISGDWRGAARAWAELGCRYEQATVFAWHGDADAQLEALAIADSLGAGALASLLRRQLRARGVRKVPRGSRKSTRSHPHGLTHREAQVLQLLSEGMANARIARRLFVSTKTVEHHVSAILAKLGVPSRTEAIALARTQKGAGN